MYQWEYKNAGTWEVIPGANQDEYSTGTLTVGTYLFRVAVTQDAGCSVVSDSVEIVGVSDAIVDVTADDLSICDGATVSFSATVTGGTGSPTYQWQLNVAGTWTDISGADTLLYTTSALSTGTYQYRLEVSQDGGCYVTSSAVTVTVVADPVLTVIATDTSICAGAVANLEVIVSGGTGTTLYQWQINNTGWTDISGENDSTLVTSALTTGTYMYRVLVTQDAGCDVESDAITIHVANDPTVGVSVNDNEICEGGVVTLSSSTSGGSGSNNYQWQMLNGSVWDDIVGADSAMYTTGPLSTATYSYRLQVTQNEGCETVSATLNITVVADPTVLVTISDNQICEGGNVVLTGIVSGGTGNASYQWQENTGISGWQDIVGEVDSFYTASALPIGSFTYRLNVIQDAGCEVLSSIIPVEVVAQPTLSITVDDNEICEGGTVTIDAAITGGTGSTHVQWQEFIGASWVDILNDTSCILYIANA